MCKKERRKIGFGTLLSKTKFNRNGLYLEDELNNAVGFPIFQNVTFKLTDAVLDALKSGRPRECLIYTRYANPTVSELQKKIAMLENTEDALSFSSGMSAIACTLFAFLKSGDHIVSTSDVYGGTQGLLSKELPSMNISVTFIKPEDVNHIEDFVTENTRMFFFETLSNPLLKLIDIRKLSEVGKKRGIITVVDNTFLTPINLRPLDYGIDIVIHSATKFLNGHSDVVAGVAAGKKVFIDKIWDKMIRVGACLDPHSAFLVDRGLKTLHLRIAQHNKNALEIAKFLEKHPQVKRVIYPGLESHPDNRLAKSILQGCGGMVSFEVHGGERVAMNFVKELKVCTHAVSLGATETLVCVPYNSCHATVSDEEKKKMGVSPGLVRMSVGIENVEDLIYDINTALKRAVKSIQNKNWIKR